MKFVNTDIYEQQREIYHWFEVDGIEYAIYLKADDKPIAINEDGYDLNELSDSEQYIAEQMLKAYEKMRAEG